MVCFLLFLGGNFFYVIGNLGKLAKKADKKMHLVPLSFHRYQKILAACALKSDLNLLPAGDMTEVGEKVSEYTV